MVAFSICNAVLALKKQHVQPMHERFEKEKDALRVFKEQRDNGQIARDIEFRFTADMKTFPPPVVPIETLETLVFEKISAYGRPLALVSVLNQSLVGLREAIAKRDAWIHSNATGAIPAEQLPYYYYFGMPLPSGDINQEHPDVVEAIHSYVGDVAFFSALLCDDLVKHGKTVRANLSKRFGKGVPEVSTPDFSGSREKGLIPADDQYEDWLKAFKQDEQRRP